MNPATFNLLLRAQSIGNEQSVPPIGIARTFSMTASKRMRGERLIRVIPDSPPPHWPPWPLAAALKAMISQFGSVAAVTSAMAALASRAERHEPAIIEPSMEPLTSRARRNGLPHGSAFWKVA